MKIFQATVLIVLWINVSKFRELSAQFSERAITSCWINMPEWSLKHIWNIYIFILQLLLCRCCTVTSGRHGVRRHKKCDRSKLAHKALISFSCISIQILVGVKSERRNTKIGKQDSLILRINQVIFQISIQIL